MASKVMKSDCCNATMVYECGTFDYVCLCCGNYCTDIELTQDKTD